MTYSYTNFLNGNSNNSNRANATSGGNEYPASPRQLQFYVDLCKRKRVEPTAPQGVTGKQLAVLIDELQAKPDPASQPQIDKILELQKEIIDAGGDLKPITSEVMNSLTGGRNGTASELIQTLFDMRAKLSDQSPPSEAQMGILVQWFLCPDIPFEEYNIDKFKRNEKNEKIMLDPNEFAQAIKDNMSRREASFFIDKYQSDFYNWRKTRITPGQYKFIRDLEERMSRIDSPKQVEFAIVDGQVTQITTAPASRDYSPIAYNPLEEMQIAQMSYDDASEWIQQLQAELKDKENRTMYGEEQVFGNSQQMFEDNRHASNVLDARAKELEAFQSLIFSVEAVAGYKSDEIHELVNDMILEDLKGDDLSEAHDRIREFFLSTITADPKRAPKRHAKEVERIHAMCEDVPTAYEILIAQ